MSAIGNSTVKQVDMVPLLGDLESLVKDTDGDLNIT